MRRRPASRVILVDPDGRVLLFLFVHKHGALAGRTFLMLPGGGVEDGESFIQAAVRELREETGITVDSVGVEVARCAFVMTSPAGELLLADERFFLVETAEARVVTDGWTAGEAELIAEARWWQVDELAQATAELLPPDLTAVLRKAMASRAKPTIE